MSENSWYRFAPLAIIVLVILWIVAALLFALPAVDASGDSIRQDYAGDRSLAFWAIILRAIAVVFLVIFVARVADELRAEGGDAAGLSPIVAGAGFVLAVMLLAGLAASAALAFNAADLSASDARLLHILSFEAWAVAMMPMTLLVLAAALGFILSKAFDAWLGWSGIVAAIIAFTGVTQLYADSGFWSFSGAWGYISIIVPALWLAITGVALAFPRVVHHELHAAGSMARA